MIKLTAQQLTYTVHDESGYRFTVDAVFDPEWGWTASVSMSVHGVKTADAAVEALASPAKHFLMMLAEGAPSCSGEPHDAALAPHRCDETGTPSVPGSGTGEGERG